MINMPRGIVSFVLRFTEDLWQDVQGEPHVQWRGQIRHVQGSEEIRFTTLAEAFTFIQRHLTELTIDSLKGGNFKMEQDKILRESFKLWEQFASTYSNMMFEAMERTIKQSEALKEQMDESVEKALKSWPLPVGSNQDQILAALNRLQDQVAELTKQVERLEKTGKNKE